MTGVHPHMWAAVLEIIDSDGDGPTLRRDGVAEGPTYRKVKSDLVEHRMVTDDELTAKGRAALVGAKELGYVEWEDD